MSNISDSDVLKALLEFEGMINNGVSKVSNLLEKAWDNESLQQIKDEITKSRKQLEIAHTAISPYLQILNIDSSRASDQSALLKKACSESINLYSKLQSQEENGRDCINSLTASMQEYIQLKTQFDKAIRELNQYTNLSQQVDKSINEFDQLMRSNKTEVDNSSKVMHDLTLVRNELGDCKQTFIQLTDVEKNGRDCLNSLTDLMQEYKQYKTQFDKVIRELNQYTKLSQQVDKSIIDFAQLMLLNKTEVEHSCKVISDLTLIRDELEEESEETFNQLTNAEKNGRDCLNSLTVAMQEYKQYKIQFDKANQRLNSAENIISELDKKYNLLVEVRDSVAEIVNRIGGFNAISELLNSIGESAKGLQEEKMLYRTMIEELEPIKRKVDILIQAQSAPWWWFSNWWWKPKISYTSKRIK
jgi:chromosome segregation ATPase